MQVVSSSEYLLQYTCKDVTVNIHSTATLLVTAEIN